MLFTSGTHVDGRLVPLYFQPDIKLTAVLTAFCDESMSGPNADSESKITCVGGYLFNEDQQKSFSEQWSVILKPLKSKGISYFHAYNCFNRIDEPRNKWSNLNFAERYGLMGDLVTVIRSSAIMGFVAKIDDQIFDREMARNKLQNSVGSKYAICTFRVLNFWGRWANENSLQGKIIYRFESGNEHEPELGYMLKQIADNPILSERFRYGTHSFEPKDAMLPLQAADLLMWLLQRSKSPTTQTRELFKRLLFQSGRDVAHKIEHITSISLNMTALEFMDLNIRSNKKHPEQTGPVRTYSF